MKKHLFWLIVISLNALIAQAQNINIKIDTLAPGEYRFYVLPDTPPASLYTKPVSDSLKAAWGHFWMFSDGKYSKQDTFVRSFSNEGPVEVMVKRRGKYSKDDEPPPAERSIDVSPPLVTVPTVPSTAPEAEIVLEWGAARSGDSVYAAIVVRNKETYLQRGNVRLLYPTDAFQNDIHLLYESNETVSRSNEPSNAVDSFPEGRIQEWELQNMAPQSERVIFVWLQLRGSLSDSVYHLFLDWNLEPLGQANPDNGGDDVFFRGEKAAVVSEAQIQITTDDNKRESSAASTTMAFNGQHRVSLLINAARDPNSLIVWPSVIRPTEYMPPDQKGKPIDLEFTGHIENMGSAMANRVTMDIRFSPKIDKLTFERRYEIKPSCVFPCTALTPIEWQPIEDDSLLIYNFRNIDLRPSAGPDVSDEYINMRKVEFGFGIKTKPNLIFKHGDKIVTKATVRMFNVNEKLESLLDIDTLPATVNVLKPGRQPFGLIFGAKIYSHLNNSDNAEGRGLSLTLRCPLIKPRGNSISSGYLQYMPKLYWQFELGYGQGAFQQPSDNQLFKVNYLHFTPVQLRYLHPVNLTSFLRYIGVSAGYSADYALSGKVNGRKAPLPSGFFDRFENELAVSLDFSNRLNVPSVTLGIGYKFRQNNLTGQSVNYSMPFVYAQLDIIRFRRHFAQVWNTVHRW